MAWFRAFPANDVNLVVIARFGKLLYDDKKTPCKRGLLNVQVWHVVNP